MDSGSISSVVLLSQATNIAMGLIGFGAFYLMARFLDWSTGRKASTHIAIIEQDAKALALYRGLRILGALYFVAQLLK